MDQQPYLEDDFDVVEPDAANEPAPAATPRRVPRPITRPITRLTTSLPGAIGGALLVTAIALGAAGHLAGSPAGAGAGAHDGAPGGETAQGGSAGDGAAGEADSNLGDGATTGTKPETEIGDEPAGSETDGSGATGADGDGEPAATEPAATSEPTTEPAPRTEPEPTPKPTPKPEPTPKPAPEIGSIGLTVTLTDGGKPRVDWTTCTGDWDYAKVVRSTNDGVSFPLGSGDSSAGVFGRDGATAMTDGDAAAGKTLWYRVFCVRKSGDGYVVVAVSPARKITTPAAEPLPEPDPVALELTVGLTDGGAVALSWSTCSSEHFVAYKVIRSAGPNPSYLPGTDGSVVIAVKESAGATSFVDTSVEPGQTWFYRVQCIGWMNDHKILLGQTDVGSATVPS